ncbi:protein kinase domain-containing protein [Citrus sinensis]|nr:protein kinase domain-containing protein [Citrus sinensis]
MHKILICFYISVTGFISLDCGSPKDSNYTDSLTGLNYTSDSAFIGTGISKSISPEFKTEDLNQQLWNVRSFPEGKRNCYNVKLPRAKNNKHLIRARLMYGNCDARNVTPQFDLHLQANFWVSVKLENADNIISEEIIHVPSSNYLQACLVNTGLGTPFISALEIRSLNNTIDKTKSCSLHLFSRLDIASTTKQMVRYQDDAYYDRIWMPFNLENWGKISTSLTIDDGFYIDLRPPEVVMRTAATPANASEPLEFYLITDDTLEFNFYFYFAELTKLQPNESREFNISFNGKHIYGPLSLEYLYSLAIFSVLPTMSGGDITSTKYNEVEQIALTRWCELEQMTMWYELEQMTSTRWYELEQITSTRCYEIEQITSTRCYEVEQTTSTRSPRPCAMSLTRSPRPGGLNLSRSPRPGRGCEVLIDRQLEDYMLMNVLLIISASTGDNRFSIYKIKDSTLPPILNAIEIYTVKQLLQHHTDEQDVDAIKSIKSISGVKKNWQGDPCVPRAYIWNGLNCSYDGFDPSRIMSLNLSASGLTGEIAPYFSNLPLLQYLNLEGNMLTGLVPIELIERSKKGSLSLSIGGNPELCSSDTCKAKKKFVIPVAASAVTLFILITALTILWILKRRKQQVGKVDTYDSLELENRRFSHSQILRLTNNFEKVLGKGGSGTVYQGYLDTTPVAIKMLYPSSVQGTKQFEAELKQHKVRIELQIIAKYSYGSTDRDVKSTNILLDDEFQAKLSDFGLSRTFPVQGGTRVSTALAGNPGYLDPEYIISDRLTEKSDVHSFGIVLLEIITGQPVIKEISENEKTHISQWVTSMLAKGDVKNIADPRLKTDFDFDSFLKAVETAMACVSLTAAERPTMNKVSMKLNEYLAMEVARTKQTHQPYDTE